MWLYDLSLQDDEDDFEVSIFRREEDQFPRLGPGDVVYLQSTRVTAPIPSTIHNTY